MKAEQHRGKDLYYLNIYPDDYDSRLTYPLVIMLHGFGANMKDLASLAPVIHRQGYVYCCPNALLPFDIGPGMVGYGWHPRRGEAAPEDFQRAEDLLNGFFKEVIPQLNAIPGRVLLLGFSQGGGMTYRCGLRSPETFVGLVTLSASLPDPEELRPKLPSQRDQPVFIAHGRSDPLVSVDSARATVKFLESEGYRPDYHEYDMAHEIPPMVLEDLIPWLIAVLPPLPKD
jgi:phospholipase/carboxylesterase